MVTVINKRIHDVMLADMALQMLNNWNYFSVGTGTAALVDAGTSLDAPVQIGATILAFNDVGLTGTLNAFQSGRSFVRKFDLDIGEPNVQPVNLTEIGLANGALQSDSVGVRALLAVAQTKDSTVRWKLRFQGRMNRQGENI